MNRIDEVIEYFLKRQMDLHANLPRPYKNPCEHGKVWEQCEICRGYTDSQHTAHVLGGDRG